jgi:REP element-mobilizing transposase RayT
MVKMANQYNPDIHHRRAIRLQDYDYNQGGAYFITFCVKNRGCLLGEIKEGSINLNEYGKIVLNIWNYLPNYFQDVEIDAAVIMPNHFHGIMIITDNCRGLVSKPSVSKSLFSNKSNVPFYQKKTRLGTVIAYFKYQTTKLINLHRDLAGVKFWQKNYYEHIIRNQKSLEILREYIINNPLNWETDQLHPNNPSRW